MSINSSDILQRLSALQSEMDGKPASVDGANQCAALVAASYSIMYGLLRIAEAIEEKNAS